MKVTIEIPDTIADELINDVFMNIDILTSIYYWAEHIGTTKAGMKFRETEVDNPKTFIIDRLFAEKCITWLVTWNGDEIDTRSDSSDYDNAVQMVIFGEIKYA